MDSFTETSDWTATAWLFMLVQVKEQLYASGSVIAQHLRLSRNYCTEQYISDVTSSVFVSSSRHIDPQPQWVQPHRSCKKPGLCFNSLLWAQHDCSLGNKGARGLQNMQVEKCVCYREAEAGPSKLGESVLWTGQTGDKTGILQPISKCLI